MAWACDELLLFSEMRGLRAGRSAGITAEGGIADEGCERGSWFVLVNLKCMKAPEAGIRV